MALVVLLGGARSGKSRLAVELAAASGASVTFVATGEARDDEMEARIAAHRADRPAGWETLEEPYELERALTSIVAGRVVVVDCLSLWVANALERGDGQDAIVESARRAACVAASRGPMAIGVSNEVGLGIVPGSPAGRLYRDILGNVNRVWVEASAEASLVVAGRALRLESVAALAQSREVSR